MRKLLRWILGLLFSVRVSGRKILRFEGPSVVMPNHVSFLDAVLLYAYLPAGACFVVNTAIAARIRFLLGWIDHVVVDPLNPYSLKKIVAAVREGRPVVLFPEGRITRTGNLMKVYSGIGVIALRSGATLYPVILSGPELSRFSRMGGKCRLRWFPPVTLHFGPPALLTLRPDTNFRQQKKEISERVLALLQETKFQAIQGEERCDNLFDKLLQTVKTQGNAKTAAEDIGGSISYRKVLIGSYALGGRLRNLLAGEDTVGVLLPNSIGHLVTLFSLFWLAKTPAIMNFSTGAENNLHCGETAGLRTILTSRAFIEKGRLDELAGRLAAKFRLLYLEDVKAELGWADTLPALLRYLRRQPARRKGTPALILFTSGSESRPKGVVLHHSQIIANINQIACVIDYTPADKMLNALPMFHSFGLTAGTLLPVFSGVEVFLYPSPLHYRIVPEIAYDRNATILLGTPTFLHGYAKYCHPYDFYSIRYVLAGGEKLKDEVRQLWSEKFGLRIFEGYGTTETAPVLSLNTPMFCRAGTVGRFLPGIEWRTELVPGIADGGDLLVRGPNVMAGYLLHDRGFAPAPEWYDCGDLVSVDPDGYVTVKSRLKRFAKVSGEMVSLDGVEKTAELCFGTDRNAAVNLPDEKKGEKIVLYTMHKQAGRQQLREYMARSGQSMLFLPAEVVVIEKLPLLGSGKTDYVSLKAMARKDAQGE